MSSHRHRFHSRAALAVASCLLFTLSGCVPDDDPPRTDLGEGSGGRGSPPLGAGGASVVPDGYPPGPYGGDVGGVIFDYAFEGFVNESAIGDPTEQPYVPYSLAAMRDSGKSYALLVLAETWCTGCATTASKLGERADELAAFDAVVVEVLLSGDRTDLEGWVAAYDLTVTTVLAVSPSFAQDLGGRERGVIVDLATMEIVYNELGGFDTGTVLVEEAFAKLQELGATGV